MELTTVIEKLSPSAIFFESKSCKCKENNAEKVIVKKYSFKSLDFPELKQLSREGQADYSKSISYPEFRGALRNQAKVCNVCVADFRIDFFFVPGSTWFIYFLFTRLTVYRSVNVFEVPKIFVAHELFDYENVAIFELGYISCGTTTAVGGRHSSS